MAEEKRLIGDDGRLAKGSLAASATTDVFENDSWYQITAKAAAGSVFGDLVVGDFYYAPIEIAATLGDEAKRLTLTTILDLSGWSLSITGDEVEVTVLADKYKKYRRGKLDANGTARFVFIKGITDIEDGMANYFFDVVEIDDTGTVTVRSDKLTDPLYVVGYMFEGDAEAEVTLATVLSVEFFSFPMNFNISEAVTMEIPFRLTGDDDPILYRIEVPGST